ncbi:hypothetical protein [Chitinophaga sp. LS1]|uniref:hypothetical protein n=1 Tax=Chitinophaga sp. LS1 TaxID=3051176 RepID=UPI002AAB68F6|nr:hypothetical protein [Chitinophaga sp. LS1]WPV67518.1 hypothetical protein QQL36_02105 [Chitinophaga sp. LS1]
MKNKKSKQKQPKYLYRDAEGNPEFAKIQFEDDWECPCGPDAMRDSFWPCDNFGNLFDPSVDSRKYKILCKYCGRIFHPSTGQVLGRRNVDYVDKEHIRVYG